MIAGAYASIVQEFTWNIWYMHPLFESQVNLTLDAMVATQTALGIALVLEQQRAVSQILPQTSIGVG